MSKSVVDTLYSVQKCPKVLSVTALRFLEVDVAEEGESENEGKPDGEPDAEVRWPSRRHIEL